VRNLRAPTVVDYPAGNLQPHFTYAVPLLADHHDSPRDRQRHYVDPILYFQHDKVVPVRDELERS